MKGLETPLLLKNRTGLEKKLNISLSALENIGQIRYVLVFLFSEAAQSDKLEKVEASAEES